MSSDDDMEAFNMFLIEQKNKVKSKYVDKVELQKITNPINNFIVDDNSHLYEEDSVSYESQSEIFGSDNENLNDNSINKSDLDNESIKHSDTLYIKKIDSENLFSENIISDLNSLVLKTPTAINKTTLNSLTSISKLKIPSQKESLNTLNIVQTIAKDIIKKPNLDDLFSEDSLSDFNLSLNDSKSSNHSFEYKTPKANNKVTLNTLKMPSDKKSIFNIPVKVDKKSLNTSNIIETGAKDEIKKSVVDDLFSEDSLSDFNLSLNDCDSSNNSLEFKTPRTNHKLSINKSKIPMKADKKGDENMLQLFKTPIMTKNKITKMESIVNKTKSTTKKKQNNKMENKENIPATPLSKKIVNKNLTRTVPTKKFSKLRPISDSENENDNEDNSDTYDDSFIDDNESSSNTDDEDSHLSEQFTDSSDDSSDDRSRSQFVTPKLDRQRSVITNDRLLQTEPLKYKQAQTLDFISSLLDNIEDRQRHLDSVMYRKKYKLKKEELALKIYHLYNEKAFDNQLPIDVDISWNATLRKTAGKCHCYRSRDGLNYSIKIKLSKKVLTDCDRLLKTLVHEICHGATWMISKVNDHHGAIWKAWVMKAHRAFPKVPLSTRCHNYKILYKFEYLCLACNNSVKRHSKSLSNKKVCGRCKGKFTLYRISAKGERIPVEKTQTLNAFSAFVKENYCKYRKTGVSHVEVMKKLSIEYKNINKSSNDDELCDLMKTINIGEK